MKPFSSEALAKSVHDSLEAAYVALPAGKSHAILVDASTADGIRALYVRRLPDGWNVAAETAWKGGKTAEGRVSVLKAW